MISHTSAQLPQSTQYTVQWQPSEEKQRQQLECFFLEFTCLQPCTVQGLKRWHEKVGRNYFIGRLTGQSFATATMGGGN